MEWTDKKDTVILFLKKYRWAALVLLVGLVLMSLPEGKADESISAQEETVQQQTLQQELESLLSKLDGAGKVKVLLSLASGAQTYYQSDEDMERSGDNADKRAETVIITSADRSQQGLVQRIDPPVYLGAVVLCQGADRAQVRLAVVDAVSTATGLTSDKISVLKMNG